LWPVKVLNIREFGLPQQRRRSILLAVRDDQPAVTYPEPTQIDAVSVWDAIGDLGSVVRRSRVRDSDSIRLTERELDRLEASSTRYVQTLRPHLESWPDNGYPREWERALIPNVRMANHDQSVIDRFRDTSQGACETVSRYHRLAGTGHSSTLRAGTGRERGSHTSPRPIHPHQHRVITVREAARLHSFPDWFRFHNTNWHGFREVGNAVPPSFARRLAEQLLIDLGLASRPAPGSVALGDSTRLSWPMSRAERFLCARYPANSRSGRETPRVA
jgi:DNA (cytosine-5)-methyltransferase 1